MKLRALSLGLLAGSFVVHASGQPALSSSDASEIRATYKAFTTAGTTDEFRSMGRFFSEDAVWMPHTGAPVHGRADIQKWFTVRAVKFEHNIEELAGSGDIAYTRASFTLGLDQADFKPCDGDALAVWRRGAAGRWLIHNYAQTFDAVCMGTE